MMDTPVPSLKPGICSFQTAKFDEETVGFGKCLVGEWVSVEKAMRYPALLFRPVI